MSTWIYLQCADHNPPLVSPYEVGQHLSDLPQIFADLRDRDRIVTNCHDDISPDDYFRKHTAQFLAQHPQCQIEVWDEYSRQHTDPNKGELMTDEPTTPEPTSLTGEQVSALDTARSCLLERHWEVAEAIEKAFPEAFEPEPEPEPGADIPDEVVEAAMEVLEAAHVETIRTKAWDSMRTIRAALAAADAKRAELEGGER